MRAITAICIIVLGSNYVVDAQTWPDFYLTNGYHTTSYGVETYDPLNPVKNLYIEGGYMTTGDALSDIYDGNQVYLDGGDLYISVPIDVDDLTWTSGGLTLWGEHNSFYGINSGTGKTLYLGTDGGSAIFSANEIGALPGGNRIVAAESLIYIDNLYYHSSNHHFRVCDIEVTGNFSWIGTSYKPSTLFNRLVLKGPSARWVDYRISMSGQDFASIDILDGAKVIGTRGYASSFVTISGIGSELDIAEYFSLDDYDWASSTVRIVNSGVMKSGGAAIGRVGPGAGGNRVEVSGQDSRWLNTGKLSLLVSDRLIITDGGEVYNTDVALGYGITDRSSAPSYDPQNNSALVSGDGSKWHISGELVLGGPGLTWDNQVIVGSGGEVYVQNGLVIWDVPDQMEPNYFHLNNGGCLTVRTNFNASMEGFNFNAGSTLAVHEQLTDLPVLEIDRRLEAVDVLGDLTVLGTFAPGNVPADTILQGSLTLDPVGTLEMEIGGGAPGYYDQLTITGTASLGGTLDVRFVDGYVPTNKVSFQLFNWGSVAGGFADISLPELPYQSEWDLTDLYTKGVLTVMPVIWIPEMITPTINLKSKGRIPITLYSADSFDVSSIDPSTVRLAGAAPVHWKLKDTKLQVQFEAADLDIDPDGEVMLIGQTYDGVLVVGMSKVKVVPSKKGKK